MTTDEAYALGVEDGNYVRNVASDASATIGRDEATVIVDGSMMAPSWRVLGGGERVWETMDLATGEAYDPIDAYIDGLDRTIDSYGDSDRDFGCLSWDEGCLFLFGPDFDHEDF